MPWVGTIPGDERTPRRMSLFAPESDADKFLQRIRSYIPTGNEELPEDFYYNPDLHDGLTQIFLDCTHIARQLVDNDNFNYAIICVIILAGVNIGVQSYDQMADIYILDILDFVILMVFSFEVVVKILAEGLAPWVYFTGKEWKWNNFDFAIVFMSLPFWNGLFGGGSLALLRLVRLMRLAKLIKKVPQLQMIVDGLSGGLSSIGYILLLLILIFYLFAVAGFYMFHINDPFHFKTLPISMITMFRCATLDAWSDVMYLNNLGCDGYDYLYVDDEDRTEENRLFWCEHPSAQYILSVTYFVIFVVISALVVLSLFIGAVTLSMNDSLNELKQLATEAKKAERMKKVMQMKFLTSTLIETRKHISVINSEKSTGGRQSSRYNHSNSKAATPDTADRDAGRASPNHDSPSLPPHSPKFFESPLRAKRVWSDADAVLEYGSGEAGLQLEVEQKSDNDPNSPTAVSVKRRHRKFSMFMPAALKNAMDLSEHQHSITENAEIRRKLRIALGELPVGIEDESKSVRSFISRIKSAKSWQDRHSIFAEYCKFIAEHPKFVGMVTLVICLAGVNVGAQTDPRITSIPVCGLILEILDVGILAVFTFECVIKILGEGTRPWVYFRDNWNNFDFIIVVGSYVPGAGSLLTMLRLLRLLRVLKLVKSLPQLALIVNALMMGMSSIGYIGLILFLCFYVFAILGMILFKQNDPFHFGNLHIAMFSLFRSSTLDDWSEILYVNMYGCDRYPGVYEDFPELCQSPRAIPVLACLYFLAFIVIGAQVLLTLFIGVVTTSMEEAKSIQDAEFKLERQSKTLKSSLELTDVQMRHFRDVFAKLDIDGGGTIQDEELSIGLRAIGDLLEGGSVSVEERAKQADPNGRGIDLITFIIIMCDVPCCRRKRLLRKAVKRFRDGNRKSNIFSKIAHHPALQRKALEEVFRKNAADLNNLLFGRVSLTGKHELVSTTPSDEVDVSSATRRRSGTWVPETCHEVSTIIEMANSRGISSDSGDAIRWADNRSTLNPNRHFVKSQSDRRLCTKSPANPTNRSMSLGQLPSAVVFTKQNYMKESDRARNISFHRRKDIVRSGADDIKDFDEE